MNDSINDGGPAYPTTVEHGFNNGEPGMTLRDYFASDFSKGMLASGQCAKEYIRDCLCTDAFTHADAMIKARSVCVQ